MQFLFLRAGGKQGALRMWLGFFGNREWRGMELDEPENGVVEDFYICYNSAE